MKPIRGAGGGGGKGGGGGGRTPVESPDSLRSRQKARVIDLICEGEVEGLVDGLKSVYLNDTPVQNSNGSMNFSGMTMASRNGTQSQDFIPGFPAVESETAVSVLVENASPIVRTISNLNNNAVRVTVSVPRLTYQNPNNGDLSGTSVALAIDVQSDGGGYVTKISDTISGKTTSRYQRAYRIELEGDGPWDVRLRRLSADSTQSNLQNDIYWDSYTEIIDARLSYPNTALIALSIDAERFQSIPSRGYEMKGLKIRIPSNYDPIARTYDGVWDGTFTTAWSNNPPWCFYDMLTSERYGLGAFIAADQVDKWSLYQIAQYCDEMVDDGLGGQEPRFTCNLYLQTQDEAYNVINSMASIFCGLPFWSGGAITAVQDAPSDPVALFTNANTIEDADGNHFNYSGSSLKTRHTVALVSWNDPADRYKQKIEYVADEEGIARYGVVQTQVVAIGCTSRGQAHRYGRRILFAERMETEVVSFSTGLDGLVVAPGDIVQTNDPVRAGARMGGRIISASCDELTLDAAVTLSADQAYTLWAVLPDGAVQSRAVTTAPGEVDVLQVSPAFSDAPQAMAMWVLSATNLVPESWRITSIAETDGTQASITALAYRSDKYDAIENGIVLEPLPTSTLDTAPNTPTDLSISESLYLVTSAVVGTRITVSWLGAAAYYELQYRRLEGNWSVISTSGTSVDIQPVEPGYYEFTLTAVNAIGRRSLPRTTTWEVVGKTAPPVDITGFTVIKSSGVAVASWLQHPDLDVRVGGRIVIRHSPKLVDVDWNDGYILEEFGGDTVTGILPLVTGTYMAKARDSSGNWSVAEVLFKATEGMVTGFTTVGVSVQAPGFTGLHTNIAVIDGTLQIDGAVLIDDITDLIDTWAKIDALGGVASSGSYEFDAVMDLGTVATRRFESDITARSFDTGDTIDSRLDLIDDWDSIDGDVINDCDVTLLASATDDDPEASPVWGDWTPFFVSDFTCRALRFRLDLVSGQSTHNIAVSELTVHAKIPA